MRFSVLQKPYFLLALGLLFWNDHYAKYAWPGFWTGKLSDFCGVFAFALFLGQFTSRKLAVTLTALLFLYWKSPLSTPLLDALNRHTPLTWQRVVDYGDLWSLGMLAIAYFILKNIKKPKKTTYNFIIGVFSIFIFTATSVYHRVALPKNYPLSKSKSAVYTQLQQLERVAWTPTTEVTDSFSFALPVQSQCGQYLQLTVRIDSILPDSCVLQLLHYEMHCAPHAVDDNAVLAAFERWVILPLQWP